MNRAEAAGQHLLEKADGSPIPFRYYFAQREAVEKSRDVELVRRAEPRLAFVPPWPAR